MNERMLYFCFFLIVIISAIRCSSARETAFHSRIVGGIPVNNINIPYIVSLVTYGFHGCGGAIISERTVLTAAHCLVFTTPRLLKVHVGAKTRSLRDGTLFAVDSIHAHEDWSMDTMDYDIGLVRLSRPLEYDATVQPILLPNLRDVLNDDDYVTIAGWGLTSSNGQMSQILRYARVPIVNKDICNHLLNGRITDRMICAGYARGGVDACQMDSGGPMVKGNKIFGIVSWGIGCALPNKPGVYTRVQRLLPWINETLKNNYNELI